MNKISINCICKNPMLVHHNWNDCLKCRSQYLFSYDALTFNPIYTISHKIYFYYNGLYCISYYFSAYSISSTLYRSSSKFSLPSSEDNIGQYSYPCFVENGNIALHPKILKRLDLEVFA